MAQQEAFRQGVRWIVQMESDNLALVINSPSVRQKHIRRCSEYCFKFALVQEEAIQSIVLSSVYANDLTLLIDGMSLGLDCSRNIYSAELPVRITDKPVVLSVGAPIMTDDLSVIIHSSCHRPQTLGNLNHFDRTVVFTQEPMPIPGNKNSWSIRNVLFKYTILILQLGA